MYLGDFRLGDTLDFYFTTRRFSSGAPFALAGTPVISAYVGNSTTQITAGITLTVDFDGVTGLNHVRVVASGANGYATATNVTLVITTGTVDSVSVVGEVVGSFSIENRSALMPTTAARTLDVNATGEAEADVVMIGADAQSATDLKDFADAGYDPGTNKVQGLVLADTVTTLTNLPSIPANWLTTAGIADGAFTAAKFAAGAFDAVWTVAARTLTSFGSLVADVATAVWGAAARTLTAATNITSTGGTTVPQTGDSFARLGLPAGASVSADIAAIKAVVDAILADTGTTLDAKIDAIKAVTDLLPDGGALSDLDAPITSRASAADMATALANQATINTNVLARATPAQVNAEVADVIRVDTSGEPTGVPPATTTLEQRINRLYMALRNGLTVTATDKTFLDDGGAAEWKKPLSDDGVTYTEGESTSP